MGFKGFDLFELRNDTMNLVCRVNEMGFFNELAEDDAENIWVSTYFQNEKSGDYLKLVRKPDGSLDKPIRVLKDPLFKKDKFRNFKGTNGMPGVYSQGKIYEKGDFIIQLKKSEKDSIYLFLDEEDGELHYVRNDSIFHFNMLTRKNEFLGKSGLGLTPFWKSVV